MFWYETDQASIASCLLRAASLPREEGRWCLGVLGEELALLLLLFVSGSASSCPSDGRS
jgi:hypothetical protein